MLLYQRVWMFVPQKKWGNYKILKVEKNLNSLVVESLIIEIWSTDHTPGPPNQKNRAVSSSPSLQRSAHPVGMESALGDTCRSFRCIEISWLESLLILLISEFFFVSMGWWCDTWTAVVDEVAAVLSWHSADHLLTLRSLARIGVSHWIYFQKKTTVWLSSVESLIFCDIFKKHHQWLNHHSLGVLMF